MPDQYPVLHVDAEPINLDATLKGGVLRTALSSYILKEIDRAEGDRSELEKKWAQWMTQYEGRLERPDATEDWQPNIDIPTTRERGIQARARIVNPILQEDRVFVTPPRRPDQDEFAKGAEEFLDYVTDQWNCELLFNSMVQTAQTFSYAVTKDAWQIDRRNVKTWQKQSGQDPMTGEPTTVYQEVQADQIIREGVFPYVVPNEDFLFPATATDVETASWVAEHTRYTEHEANARFRSKEWTADSIHEGGEDSDLRAARQELAGITPDEDRLYHVWEWYGFYDVDDDGVDEDIIAWVTRDGTVLRAVFNPEHEFSRPYLTYTWEPVDNQIPGRSFCQVLEPVHRAISAYFNMQLEAAALANGVAWATTDSEFATKFKNARIPPGAVIQLLTEEMPQELQLSQPSTALPELLAELEKHADKLAGLSDYNFGIETINRPTASGQIALIEEGKQPLYEKLNLFRTFLGRLAVRVLARYRQRWPEGVQFYSQTDKSNFGPTLLQFPDEAIDTCLVIEPKASSANLNQNVRRQEMLGLLERMEPYYTMQLQMLQLAVQPGPMSKIALLEAEAHRAVMNRVLDAFKVPLPELINPDFTEDAIAGIQLSMQLMQMQAQAQSGLPGQGPPGGEASPGAAEGRTGMAGGGAVGQPPAGPGGPQGGPGGFSGAPGGGQGMAGGGPVPGGLPQ